MPIPPGVVGLAIARVLSAEAASAVAVPGTPYLMIFSELGMVSLRQESFGKEEETRTLKPFVETLRVRIPPGKAGPAARSESCVVVGQPILRSVDSEVKGRVIEPRKYKTRGAFVVDTGGGRVRQLTLGPLSLPDPAGVEEHGQ